MPEPRRRVGDDRPDRPDTPPDTPLCCWKSSSVCDPSPLNPLVALLAGLVPQVRLVALLALRLWDLSAVDRKAAAPAVTATGACCGCEDA